VEAGVADELARLPQDEPAHEPLAHVRVLHLAEPQAQEAGVVLVGPPGGDRRSEERLGVRPPPREQRLDAALLQQDEVEPRERDDGGRDPSAYVRTGVRLAPAAAARTPVGSRLS
jgi:hypothetical protein